MIESSSIEVPRALTPDSLAALRGAVCGARPGRTLVLRGGDPFCEGIDLAALAGTGPEARAEALSDFVRVLRALRTGPAPAVAVVAGAARGGGVGLAAACDVVLATEPASFALPEVLFGLSPAVVTAVLEARLRPQAIRRLALTGVPVSAEEAGAMGLADEVVAADAADAAVARWLRALGRAAPDGVAALKAQPAEARRLAEALDAARRVTAARLSDPRVWRRVQRFVEEGAAPWEDVA